MQSERAFPSLHHNQEWNQVPDHVPNLFVPFVQENGFAISNQIRSQGHYILGSSKRGKVCIQHFELIPIKSAWPLKFMFRCSDTGALCIQLHSAHFSFRHDPDTRQHHVDDFKPSLCRHKQKINYIYEEAMPIRQIPQHDRYMCIQKVILSKLLHNDLKTLEDVAPLNEWKTVWRKGNKLWRKHEHKWSSCVYFL